MKVEVRRVELPEVDADLRRGRPLRGRGAAGGDRRRAGRRRRQGRLQEALAALPAGGRRGCWSSGSASARTLDAERLRVAAALAAQGGRAAARRARSPGRCRSPSDDGRRRRGDRHRHDPRLLPLRPLPGQAAPRTTPPAAARVADPAGAGERRRGGRDGARLRRGPEPRPRPAEHPGQLRHARASSPSAPRRSPPATTRSAVEVLGREQIAAKGMGGLVAVSQGGPRSRG